ncbi:L,D-transpeptidase family protein [Solwaraspora sp. WMMD1047]|uniref:L,D-transpeptidase family protein n=1 Tax=Solwaraspora sp. WMMD1047 TaxID=3016102 RepID=UPI002417B760|nr:L,D-transpeptidase family protein [Solwaraspora sp. WMMD1047]MDG4832852.1 L,D-transpeptidase family protein [Solwaraspora sp. WMMD1047]
MRRALAGTVALLVAGTLVTGCGGDASDQAGPGTATSAPATSEPSAAEPTPAGPGADESTGPTTAPPTRPAPSSPAAPTPSPTPQRLRLGATGPEVTALQERLTELGYWNGGADGSFGSLTQQAVYALQKSAGIGRDGIVGPNTEKALDQGARPKAKSRSGYVVEIDLKRQVLMLVDDGRISQIFNTSTGNNENYEQDGNTYRAVTPPGKFTVSRDIDGWRDAPLGMLWRPKYFNGGIAVHGAHSVPPYPASHGCARLTVAAMNWLWTNDKLPIGTRIWVY